MKPDSNMRMHPFHTHPHHRPQKNQIVAMPSRLTLAAVLTMVSVDAIVVTCPTFLPQSQLPRARPVAVHMVSPAAPPATGIFAAVAKRVVVGFAAVHNSGKLPLIPLGLVQNVAFLQGGT